MNDNELLKRLLQSQFRLEDRIQALEEQCELYKSDLERWKADCRQSDKRLYEIKNNI